MDTILGSISKPRSPLPFAVCYFLAYGTPLLGLMGALVGVFAGVRRKQMKLQISLVSLVLYVMSLGLCVGLQVAACRWLIRLDAGSIVLPSAPWAATLLAVVWLLTGHLGAMLFLHKEAILLENKAAALDVGGHADRRVNVAAIATCFIGSAFSIGCPALNLLLTEM